MNKCFVVACVAAMAGIPIGASDAQSPTVQMDTLRVRLQGVAGVIDTLQVGRAATPDADIFLQVVRPRGTRISYALQPIKGYEKIIAMWGNTFATVPRGSAVLVGSTSFEAEASRQIRIQKENRRLFQLNRALLATKDPLAVYVEIGCEVTRLLQQYPDTTADRLVREASYLAEDPVHDAAAMRRVDNVLAGHTFSSECDVNRRALQRREHPRRRGA